MEWYFTTHTTFGELFAQPECREIAEYFIYSHGPRRLQDEMTLQDQKKKNPNRNIDSMCDGVNHLLDKVRQGVSLTWDFWSQEERDKDPDKQNTKLFYFPADSGAQRRPFVMICAGGGYTSVCSMFEGFTTARRLNQLGYTAFVLNYRVGREGLLPDPIDDLAEAIRFVLAHADTFGVVGTGYAVAGFSAGGHLVAEWGTENVGYAHYGLPKPGALFPVYPVINMEPVAQRSGGGMKDSMEGDGEATDKYSVQKHVWAGYPPTFGVHCEDDPAVPYQHSVMLQEALEKCGVPHKLKLGKVGGHGIGEGRGSDVEGWIDEAVEFWREQNMEGTEHGAGV